jgi:hypothetical protein
MLMFLLNTALVLATNLRVPLTQESLDRRLSETKSPMDYSAYPVHLSKLIYAPCQRSSDCHQGTCQPHPHPELSNTTSNTTRTTIELVCICDRKYWTVSPDNACNGYRKSQFWSFFFTWFVGLGFYNLGWTGPFVFSIFAGIVHRCISARNERKKKKEEEEGAASDTEDGAACCMDTFIQLAGLLCGAVVIQSMYYVCTACASFDGIPCVEDMSKAQMVLIIIFAPVCFVAAEYCAVCWTLCCSLGLFTCCVAVSEEIEGMEMTELKEEDDTDPDTAIALAKADKMKHTA